MNVFWKRFVQAAVVVALVMAACPSFAEQQEDPWKGFEKLSGEPLAYTTNLGQRASRIVSGMTYKFYEQFNTDVFRKDGMAVFLTTFVHTDHNCHSGCGWFKSQRVVSVFDPVTSLIVRHSACEKDGAPGSLDAGSRVMVAYVWGDALRDALVSFASGTLPENTNTVLKYLSYMPWNVEKIDRDNCLRTRNPETSVLKYDFLADVFGKPETAAMVSASTMRTPKLGKLRYEGPSSLPSMKAIRTGWRDWSTS